MRNHVVIDQIRSHVGNSFVFCRHANIPRAERKVSIGVCDSHWAFLTEVTAVPSEAAVHGEFAEGEEFSSQVCANDPFGKRCAPLKPTDV